LKGCGLAIKSYRNIVVYNIVVYNIVVYNIREVTIRVFFFLAPCHEDAWIVECEHLCILNSRKDEAFVPAFLTPLKKPLICTE